MKIKTPLDQLAVDKYFQEVIKPQARKETIQQLVIPFIVLAVITFILRIIM